VTTFTLLTRDTSATVIVDAAFTTYQRKVLDDLSRRVTQTGGSLVELLRPPEDAREQVKARFLCGPEKQDFDSYAKLKAAIGPLFGVSPAAEPVIRRQAPSAPAQEAPKAAPPVLTPSGAAPKAGPGKDSRAAPRIAVQLEVEFKTNEEFVR